MKVVILAGGRGTRLSEETEFIPKPMVTIGSRPIIWHIMRHYSAHGYNEFIVALGYKGYVVKEYFANYLIHERNVTVDLKSGQIDLLSENNEDWVVTLIDTGEETKTGGRLKRLAPMLNETFLLTYGDGLSSVPINELVQYHRAQSLLATVTAVHPDPRFGSLGIRDGVVAKFREKPSESHDRVNGGFFVMEPEVLRILAGDESALEGDLLTELALRGQLAAFEFDGFWMPMDTRRDRDELNRLWFDGHAPWIA